MATGELTRLVECKYNNFMNISNSGLYVHDISIYFIECFIYILVMGLLSLRRIILLQIFSLVGDDDESTDILSFPISSQMQLSCELNSRELFS